jgi:hypothetical protein
LSDQTLHNGLKVDAAGRLREVTGKAISAEQMEIARLKAELAKARMERDILKNRRCILRGSRGEIRLYPATSKALADSGAMPGVGGRRQRLSAISRAPDGHRPLQPGHELWRNLLGDVALPVHIKAVFNEMKGAYGWPCIWRELQARGIRAGKERVRKLMKAHGPCARGKVFVRGKRKFKATTNSAHGLPARRTCSNASFPSIRQTGSGQATSLISGPRKAGSISPSSSICSVVGLSALR